LSISNNKQTVKIGGREVGDEQPCYVVAEIGINHNGNIDLAKRLISVAVAAGCDAVKFQKRTPELCVPLDQWNVVRDTPSCWASGHSEAMNCVKPASAAKALDGRMSTSNSRPAAQLQFAQDLILSGTTRLTWSPR